MQFSRNTAGVVASANVENDNADMLALVGRLTPLQMRLHYGLYLGAAIISEEKLRGSKTEISAGRRRTITRTTERWSPSSPIRGYRGGTRLGPG